MTDKPHTPTNVLCVNQFTPPIDRFEASYMPEPNSGCWLWTGVAVTSSKGDVRPRMRLGGGNINAYRFAYQHFIGPIPDGAYICHRCDVSLCVNPDHLYAGSALTNSHDSVSRGRHHEKNRQTCLRGHPLDRVSRAGHRYCGTCQRLRKRGALEEQGHV